MQVPLLDLRAQYASLKDEIIAEISEICDSQRFILGPKVEKLESEIAAYCRSTGAVGVTSGSDALIISLMVEGIKAGDEVITTPFTFFATVGAIVRVGATPVFADIDPVTFNIDPKKIEEKITPRTKAIIPVHLFGQAADMDPIMEIARKHNLVVIEDACQAIGAEYKGRRVGSIGNYGAFSFFPSKNLGCFGDGGMVTCNDPEKVKLLKIFRNHGQSGTYMHDYVGGNFRLDVSMPQQSIVKGDALSYSIGAASILAKVHRDKLMEEYDALYPQYGFAAHKGYGTAAHIKAIREYGPCAIHRKTFIKKLSAGEGKSAPRST